MAELRTRDLLGLLAWLVVFLWSAPIRPRLALAPHLKRGSTLRRRELLAIQLANDRYSTCCAAALPSAIDCTGQLGHPRNHSSAAARLSGSQCSSQSTSSSSAPVPPDQLQLALKDIEQALAEAEVQAEKTDATLQASRSRQRRVNCGALPKHLPREEIVIEPAEQLCPNCGGALHRIGEDVAERLDVIPAQFKVIVTRRPKYGCRARESAVVQAAAPARLIEGGLPVNLYVRF